MPTYMTQFSYTADSVKAMVNKPQDRRAAAEKIFSAAGGKIVSMYFCLGEHDGVVISEFPSDVAAASALMAVGSSGAFSKLKSTVLIPMDDAVKAMKGAHDLVGSYTPPGG